MAIKKMVFECNCETPMCEHAHDKVSSLLQSGYDDGYDEGWRDAFFSIKHTLVEMGFEKAREMKLPEPPPRRSSEDKVSREVPRPSSGNKRELAN